MPFQQSDRHVNGDYTQFVDRLVTELRNPQPHGQPMIFEDSIRQTETYHVTVIWDRWRDVPEHARARIILDAYLAYNPQRVPRITLALGVTGEEAIRLGFLPVAIVPTVRRGEVEADRLKDAMRGEGAIETSKGNLQLRFRALQDAEDAYVRLQKALPGPFWSIVQEVARVE